MRFSAYVAVSLLSFFTMTAYAYYTRVQFYSATVFMVTSKVSVMILGNMVIMMTMLLGRMTKKIFLGSLRDAEVEAVYENARFAITETCLALTIFRDEITMRVGGLFLALLFAKIFHWLAQARLEYIEQSEIVGRLVHFRMVVLMSFMLAMDAAFVALAVHTAIEDDINVTFLFGFEFLILSITIVSIFGKYMLYLINLRNDGTWTNKSVYQFCLELFADIVTLLVYIIFFMIIFSYYGMPLHILRELWMSLKNLQRRITTYINYRRLTANLNERFPDVTEEQMEAMGATNRTCIICREDMSPAAGERIKKIPCGHVFHFGCLHTWLQQQQNCPTCRQDIPVEATAAERAAAAADARPNNSPQPAAGQEQLQNAHDPPALAAGAEIGDVGEIGGVGEGGTNVTTNENRGAPPARDLGGGGVAAAGANNRNAGRHGLPTIVYAPPTTAPTTSTSATAASSTASATSSTSNMKTSTTRSGNATAATPSGVVQQPLRAAGTYFMDRDGVLRAAAPTVTPRSGGSRERQGPSVVPSATTPLQDPTDMHAFMQRVVNASSAMPPPPFFGVGAMPAMPPPPMMGLPMMGSSFGSGAPHGSGFRMPMPMSPTVPKVIMKMQMELMQGQLEFLSKQVEILNRHIDTFPDAVPDATRNVAEPIQPPVQAPVATEEQGSSSVETAEPVLVTKSNAAPTDSGIAVKQEKDIEERSPMTPPSHSSTLTRSKSESSSSPGSLTRSLSSIERERTAELRMRRFDGDSPKKEKDEKDGDDTATAPAVKKRGGEKME